MKIAVPLFKNRVSPHFGASCKILIIETQEGKIVNKFLMDSGADGAGRIARYLASNGVDRIVCGGIQHVHKQWLTNRGIQVVENQKGLAEETVSNMITSEFKISK